MQSRMSHLFGVKVGVNGWTWKVGLFLLLPLFFFPYFNAVKCCGLPCRHIYITLWMSTGMLVCSPKFPPVHYSESCLLTVLERASEIWFTPSYSNTCAESGREETAQPGREVLSLLGLTCMVSCPRGYSGLSTCSRSRACRLFGWDFKTKRAQGTGTQILRL